MVGLATKTIIQGGVSIMDNSSLTHSKCMQRSYNMLVSIPPKLSVAQFMWYLKGKSSLMIFDRHANLKYRYCIWAIEFKTIYWPVYGWGGKRKQKKHLLGAAFKSMRLANCFSGE